MRRDREGILWSGEFLRIGGLDACPPRGHLVGGEIESQARLIVNTLALLFFGGRGTE